jgi:dienelactone hydrolase
MFKFKALIFAVCLIFFIVLSNDVFAIEKRAPVEIEFRAYDGFKIYGILNIPDQASINAKAPFVIFLHSICKSHEAWGEFSNEVKSSLNVATLTIDLRGHGKSIRNKKNKFVHWQNFPASGYKKMPEDVVDVINFIKNEYPEIDTNNTALVGSSLGATSALIAASYLMNIKTVIMISPMLQYKGFDMRLPIVKYGENPLLFIVSQKDKYPYESSRELMKFAQGRRRLETYPFGGNGEDILKFQPESKKLIINWLRESKIQGNYIIPDEESVNKAKIKPIKEYSEKIKNSGSFYGDLQ